MTTARYTRQRPPQPPPPIAPRHPDRGRPSSPQRCGLAAETLLAGAVVCSLLLHVSVATLLLKGVRSHRPSVSSPATVYVDLLPVARPGVAKSVSPPSAPTAAAKRESPAPPRAATVKVKGGKQVEKGASDAEIRSALDEMRRRRDDRQERESAERAIEALKKRSAQAAAAPKPVAAKVSPGEGEQLGQAIGDWLREELRARWTLSTYQLGSLDLSAEVELELDRQGRVKRSSFIKRSGDRQFDDSLISTLHKLPPCPVSLKAPWSDRVIFNLSDLQGDR